MQMHLPFLAAELTPSHSSIFLFHVISLPILPFSGSPSGLLPIHFAFSLPPLIPTSNFCCPLPFNLASSFHGFHPTHLSPLPPSYRVTLSFIILSPLLPSLPPSAAQCLPWGEKEGHSKSGFGLILSPWPLL